MVKAPYEYLWIIFRLVIIGSSYCSDVCHRNLVECILFELVHYNKNIYYQAVDMCRW